MDLMASLQSVNYLAVLVATIAAFVIGGIWYSPAVFGKQWMKVLGIKEGAAKDGMAAVMVKSFIVTFIMATTLAMFTPAGLNEGLMTGAVLGLGIAAMNSLNNMIYETKPTNFIFINVGYTLFMYLAMGAIIGAWQ